VAGLSFSEVRMAEQSYFRGYHAIKEVTEYLEPLAQWMRKHKPDVGVITLKRQDFDLLKRWPKAAQMFQVSQSPEGELTYLGFKLKFDKKPPRYNKHEAA
jgi:hypothetical protein